MNIKGYDAWKLSGPPEWDGPTCDWCGGGDDVRVESEGIGTAKPILICVDCFIPKDDDGPCFDDLQPAAEYYQDEADDLADCQYQARRDREDE